MEKALCASAPFPHFLSPRSARQAGPLFLYLWFRSSSWLPRFLSSAYTGLSFCFMTLPCPSLWFYFAPKPELDSKHTIDPYKVPAPNTSALVVS